LDWVALVFVSGTVVASIASCELSRFDIRWHSRRKLNVHFASVYRIRGTYTETGAVKDRYRSRSFSPRCQMAELYNANSRGDSRFGGFDHHHA
jgi:hypothetical protein